MHPESHATRRNEISSDVLLRAVKDRIGDANFGIWIRGRSGVRTQDDRLILDVASPFEMNWMQRKFGGPLGALAQELLGPSASVEFGVARGSVSRANLIHAKTIPPAAETSTSSSSSEATAEAAADAAEPRPSRDARSSKTARRSRTFLDFVVGPENELAWTAARRSCDHPGEHPFGPLYLYGGIGIGKTHLLDAAYAALRQRGGGLNVLKLTAETFANYFTKALRDRTLPAFRFKMRAVDVLLVDDVDFLDGKKVIQEEFLHTVKQLEERGRMMIFTADRHPRLLLKTREDLTSRLGSGMICRIETPQEETRRRIAQRKSERLACPLPGDVLDYVARRFSRTVRELEGALNCLAHFSELTGRPLTLSAARKVLADLERDCVKMIHLSDIEECVCRFFGIQPNEMKSPAKKKTVSHPRMLAMFLARKLTPQSYSAIGSYFGGRRHNTVVSAEQTVQKWIDSGAPLRIASREWTMSEVLGTLERELQAV